MTTPCSVHGCPEPAGWAVTGRPHCRAHMLDAVLATGFGTVTAVRIPPEPEPQADIVERLRLTFPGPENAAKQESLTDAQREAISSAAYLCEATAGLAHERANATAWATCAATLRGLLDRLAGGPEREQPARNDGAAPARSGETGDDSPDRE